MKANFYPYILFLGVVLSSCEKKSDGCPAPSPITIKNNGPIVAGWPLQLEAEFQSTSYLYHWTGPNGWEKHYQTYASDAYLQERTNMTTADAGVYKLQLIQGDCIKYEGTINIEVKAAPLPSCNIAANTSTSSVAGIGDMSFSYRNSAASSGTYIMTGSEPGQSMKISFLGDVPPLPGTYKTNGYWPFSPGKVGLYITSNTYDFVANPDQTVYVNKVNNKLEVTFCGVRFNNPLGSPNPITISAKMVE